MTLLISSKKQNNISRGIFLKPRLNKTQFGNDCCKKIIQNFIDSCTNAGIPVTDDFFNQEYAGVQIEFDFSIKKHEPYISASELMIDKLDLEILAQFLASWCRPVFGKTSVDVRADRLDNIIIIAPFSELLTESFTAYYRMEKLCQDLAFCLQTPFRREALSLSPVARKAF